jgi:glutaminyl-peptide cyclotransferase
VEVRAAACTLLAIAALVGCGSSDGDAPSTDAAAGAFDAQRAFADLEAQVEIGPRPAGSEASRETADLIAERLRGAGVRDIAVQRPHLNVVGRIPGGEPGVVVVGAHHDTKDDAGGDFQGANDNASGVAVVLELARALAPRAEGPSIHLALFDAEEARGHRPFIEGGMRGSRQYVRYARRGGAQGSPPLADIRAMVLFDMVGDCDLEIPREANSDPRLYGLFAAAARELDDGDSPAPFKGETGPILDDHIPFAEAGIPAVDLIDFNYGPGPSPGAWWHTPEDSLDKVCPESLAAVGQPAMLAIPRIR